MSYCEKEMRGGTLIVALSNPPFNTFTSENLEALAGEFEAIGADAPAEGVVLTGANGEFTRGMDTKVASALDDAGRERARHAINIFFAALHRLPCPLVCAINGHAIGAGGIAALCSDWVVASDTDHRIGLPEAKAGLPFPSVAQAVLDHGIDPVWRRRLALTSALLDREESLKAGLVDEIVPADELVANAVKRAADMAAQPGFGACKAQLRAKANAEIDALLA